MTVEFVHSVCAHDCPSACALEVERLGPDRIGRVRGAKAMPHTDGLICAKVMRYAERVHNPGRLTQPLRRTGPKGSGQFEAIGWDEALDAVAGAFQSASARLGPQTVWPYYYGGTMGLVQNGAIKRLRHLMGWSGMVESICGHIGGTGWLAGVGTKRGTDMREIPESDLVVIWGGNPVYTQIHMMHLVNQARTRRGAKLVVIDPYRTATAERADIHLMPRPGTDGALACAVMHVVFKEGYADRAYMARHTNDSDALEAHLASRDPAWAAAITGLTVAEIVEFARLYGATKRSYIRFGYGFTRQRNGSANIHAASCLPAVTGAWQHPGGGALFSNWGTFPVDASAVVGRADPIVRQLDMCRLGPVLAGEASDLHGGPPVTAMIVQNTNPAAVAPESALVRRGLARDDLFLAVHEQYLTETAAFADIVLPATTFVEHDDLTQTYGHSYLQAARAVIAPLGEARCNHDVVCALAKRLGQTHSSFDATSWDMVETVLRDSNLPDGEAIIAANGLDCAKPFETAHFLDGFGTADRRFHFAADWAALGPLHEGMPRLPDHFAVTEEADSEHPFRLVAPPSRHFLNTTFTETPSSLRLEGRPTARVHPDDMAALGLADGDRVRLGNRRASVVVHAKAFDGLQRGVVVVESTWPAQAFVEKLGLNALIGAEPALPAGGGAFHDTAIWIRGCAENGDSAPS